MTGAVLEALTAPPFPLPPHWKWTQLRQTVEKTEQINPKSIGTPLNYVDVSAVSRDHLRIESHEPITASDAPSRARKVMRTGDVLFATVRPALRRVASVPPELNGHVCSTAFCVIRAKPSVADPNFLYFAASSQRFVDAVAERQRGSGYPAVTDKDVLQEYVPLPPLNEQRAIAKALRAVQQAIAARRREIDLERERKAVLMQHLFAIGISGDGDGVRDTKYGPIAARWRVLPLADCAYVQTGVAKGRKLNGEKTLDVPYLRVANVQDGYLDLSEMKTIAIAEREMDRYRLKEGDVVVTEGGDFDKLGRGFIWRGQVENCVHQNHVFAVRARPDLLLPEYLAYLVQSAYGRAYFLSVAHKTTNLACINTAKLKAMPVPVPDVEEQRAIASALDACDAKLAASEKELGSLEELFRAMLEEVMAGRLSVAAMVDGGGGDERE